MFARGILVFYEANTYRDQSVMEIKILIVWKQKQKRAQTPG